MCCRPLNQDRSMLAYQMCTMDEDSLVVLTYHSIAAPAELVGQLTWQPQVSSLTPCESYLLVFLV